MTAIPRAALTLGLAGLLPFAFGAATVLSPALFDWAVNTVGPRFAGPYVLIAYGTVILCFMAGVLWGFATKAEGRRAALGYGLSVLPALWAFLFVGGGAAQAISALLVGFLALITLDLQFLLWRLVPPWWLRLRLMLTAGVVICLLAGLSGT